MNLLTEKVPEIAIVLTCIVLAVNFILASYKKLLDLLKANKTTPQNSDGEETKMGRVCSVHGAIETSFALLTQRLEGLNSTDMAVIKEKLESIESLVKRNDKDMNECWVRLRQLEQDVSVLKVLSKIKTDHATALTDEDTKG